MCYVDGSKQDRKDGDTIVTTTGSGLYAPANQHHPELKLRINPGGTQDTKTINRAELAPILVALQEGSRHTIEDDSLSSLYQVKKMLHRPYRMKYHKHRRLVEAILDAVRHSPQDTVTLVKVKAHSGVLGNEMADTLANEAAKGTEDMQVHVGTHSREGQYWIYQDTNNNPTPLPDVGPALKTVMKRAHRLGAANTDAVYYQALQAIAPKASAKHTMMFTSNPAVSKAQRRTRWQYLTGTMPHHKNLFRWGMADTPTCPLCGQESGGTHVMMSCPGLETVHTARHHAVGRVLAKAVADGRKGGYMVMADVGRKDTLPTGMEQTANNIPTWMFGKQASNSQQLQRRYRPDILLVENLTHASTWVPGIEVYIVEFKVCQDTNPVPQWERALAQHAELSTLLQNASDYKPTIHIVPVLIGAAGTIYQEYTLDSLKKLGVIDELETTIKLMQQQVLQWGHTVLTEYKRQQPPNHRHPPP